MLVGEIGISRREFLHEMRWWEVLSVVRGHDRRRRDLWSAVRWHAYQIMCAIPYTDLRKSGIHKASDLITFPWESEQNGDLPIRDVEDARELLKKEKERIAHQTSS